jgi:hypothetical protein
MWVASWTGLSIDASLLAGALDDYSQSGGYDTASLDQIFLALTYHTYGGQGEDTLVGGMHDDVLIGGAGDDFLDGRRGG